MQKLTRLSSKSGSALLAALVFGMVFAIMIAGTVQMLVTGSDIYIRDIEVIRSYWANEGTQRIAMRYLSRLSSPGSITETNLQISPQVSLNGYQPVISIVSTAVSPGASAYTVISSDTVRGCSFTNKTECRSILVKSMQRYTWFENQTGPVLRPLLFTGIITATDIWI
jgi:hypothetical protein